MITDDNISVSTNNLFRDFVNIPRAHREYERIGIVSEKRLPDFLKRIKRVGISAQSANHIRKSVIRDARNRRFARRINGRDKNLIGEGESYAETFHKTPRARIQVGVERGDYRFLREFLARRPKHFFNRCRMMRVVVVDKRAIWSFTPALKPTPRTFEIPKRFINNVFRNIRKSR